MARRWRDDTLDDAAWRPPPGLNRRQRAVEQDQAAGGRERRVVHLDGSREVLSSIYFRRVGGRRVYAYLRWSDGGRTTERFVCEVEGNTRTENLATAWRQAHGQRLLDAERPPNTPQDPPSTPLSWASSSATRRVMQGNKSRDTCPERAIRSLVHRLGLRYRVSVRPLPRLRRTADLVFARAKVAVFVDGCFWHGCPEHYRKAIRNEDFWSQKVTQNRARDEETDQLLTEAGWTVVRIWEHDEPLTAALRIRDIVTTRAARRPARDPHRNPEDHPAPPHDTSVSTPATRTSDGGEPDAR